MLRMQQFGKEQDRRDTENTYYTKQGHFYICTVVLTSSHSPLKGILGKSKQFCLMEVTSLRSFQFTTFEKIWLIFLKGKLIKEDMIHKYKKLL